MEIFVITAAGAAISSSPATPFHRALSLSLARALSFLSRSLSLTALQHLQACRRRALP